MDGDAIDTLAAALAETGDFAQAVTWQERAIELNKSPDKEEEARLELYRKGQPYREQPKKK